jgi:hypothetical protein
MSLRYHIELCDAGVRQLRPRRNESLTVTDESRTLKDLMISTAEKDIRRLQTLEEVIGLILPCDNSLSNTS